jgi:NADH:ubiquinone reductase (H+-translocating)
VDYIILATGSRTNFFNRADFITHALPLRRVIDAERIQRKMTDAKTVCVIGAGYTGVEIAAVLAENTNKHIVLVHSQERILDRMPESVSKKATKRLKKLGVELFTNSKVTSLESKKIIFADTTEYPTDLIIQTAGILANNQLCSTNALNEHYHVKPTIFYCGDACQSNLIPTAHNAMIEGREAATCLLQTINKKEHHHKKHHELPLIIALGKHYGIITWKQWSYGTLFAGFLKWIIHKRVLFEFKSRIRLPL